MSRWFRWYEGTSEDGKFRAVARESRVTVRDVIALWAFMLEDAAHLDHRGVCQRDKNFMAAILDFEDGVIESILEAMQNVSMINVSKEAITICNFGKRQFDSDTDPTAPERQRRKRERDKTVTNERVTRDSRGPEYRVQSQKQIKKEKENSNDKEKELVAVTIVDPSWPFLKARWQREHKKQLNVSEFWFPRKWVEEGSGTKAPSGNGESLSKAAA